MLFFLLFINSIISYTAVRTPARKDRDLALSFVNEIAENQDQMLPKKRRGKEITPVALWKRVL